MLNFNPRLHGVSLVTNATDDYFMIINNMKQLFKEFFNFTAHFASYGQ